MNTILLKKPTKQNKFMQFIFITTLIELIGALVAKMLVTEANISRIYQMLSNTLGITPSISSGDFTEISTSLWGIVNAALDVSQCILLIITMVALVFLSVNPKIFIHYATTESTLAKLLPFKMLKTRIDSYHTKALGISDPIETLDEGAIQFTTVYVCAELIILLLIVNLV